MLRRLMIRCLDCSLGLCKALCQARRVLHMRVPWLKIAVRREKKYYVVEIVKLMSA